MPMTSDTAGPASAILSSAAALGNIPLKRATPPKSQSVIPSSSIPSRRAVTAWPSSWPSRDTKADRGHDRHRDVRAVRVTWILARKYC